MSKRQPRREAPAVNAGSMADIAFLLLIFFLVTTTIAEDKGVLVKLPKYSEEEVQMPLNEENVLTVQVNKFDRLLVEDREVTVTQLPALLQAHIQVGKRPAGTRIVSLLHDRGTSYTAYLDVYDALKTGYHELWDAAAQQQFGVKYDFLDKAGQTAIRELVPMVISEAEPTEIL